MTQQITSTPARCEESVDTSVPVQLPDTQVLSAGAETIQKLRDRYVQWGECRCPEEILQSVRPLYADYSEKQCPICAKISGRIYD